METKTVTSGVAGVTMLAGGIGGLITGAWISWMMVTELAAGSDPVVISSLAGFGATLLGFMGIGIGIGAILGMYLDSRMSE